MTLTERDRYPPLTPTLHSIAVYLIIKAANTAAFFSVNMNLYKVRSDYLDESWVVMSESVKDAASQVIFNVKDKLALLESMLPGVDVDIDLKVEKLPTTIIKVPNARR